MSWYVFQIKNRYSKDIFLKQFYRKLKDVYDISSKDIFLNIDAQNEGMNHYVFINTQNCSQLWEKLRGDKFIQAQFGYHQIKDKEMMDMRNDVQSIREQIGFGDIVKIKSGKYNKLYGIVLRQRSAGRYQVGLKFCCGVKIELQQSKDLQIVGNIFQYIKVRR